MTAEYKGISFPFRFSPSGGVAKSTSADIYASHIREKIIQLLRTEPGERAMEPEYGCRLRDVIFEPIDATLYHVIYTRIVNAVTRWIPEVSISDVSINSTEDSVNVHLTFRFAGQNFEADVNYNRR